eukprot:COSAG02_NODE_298_length_25350_cov_48.266999_16_plen_168_part_00
MQREVLCCRGAAESGVESRCAEVLVLYCAVGGSRVVLRAAVQRYCAVGCSRERCIRWGAEARPGDCWKGCELGRRVVFAGLESGASRELLPRGLGRQAGRLKEPCRRNACAVGSGGVWVSPGSTTGRRLEWNSADRCGGGYGQGVFGAFRHFAVSCSCEDADVRGRR